MKFIANSGDGYKLYSDPESKHQCAECDKSVTIFYSDYGIWRCIECLLGNMYHGWMDCNRGDIIRKALKELLKEYPELALE